MRLPAPQRGPLCASGGPQELVVGLNRRFLAHKVVCWPSLANNGTGTTEITKQTKDTNATDHGPLTTDHQSMLPAHLAENIRKQVLFYLQSTFDFRDKQVERAFTRFLEDPDTGLFKGPWVQLRRPFRPATADAKMPFTIRPGFHPFRHQWLSWMRLSSQGQKPKPTIVTTGI